MQRLAACPVAIALTLVACSSPSETPLQPSDTTQQTEPHPPPAPAVLPPPDPDLVAYVVRQTESAVNIAEKERSFLAQARGNRLRAIMDRLSFEVPLSAAKAAHESAPEATEAAYQASVAAHEAAFRHSRLYFNRQSDIDELLAAKAERDATFQAALDAWKQFQSVEADSP